MTPNFTKNCQDIDLQVFGSSSHCHSGFPPPPPPTDQTNPTPLVFLDSPLQKRYYPSLVSVTNLSIPGSSGFCCTLTLPAVLCRPEGQCCSNAGREFVRSGCALVLQRFAQHLHE